jgi:two-component system phosphate regulon sensor histidine kinase PhoR
MRLAFSPKLRLAPVWPAAGALLVAAGLATARLPAILAQESAREQVAIAGLVARALAPAAAPSGQPDPELQERVAGLAAASGHRITVIGLDGRVHADSDRAPEAVAAMDDHRTRPEVAAAIGRGEGEAIRHSDTTGADTAYGAVVAHAADGAAYVVRVGRPLAGLAAVRGHLAQTLLTSALVAAGVVALLSWWLSRRLFAPLSALIAAADEIGRGRYEPRIPAPEARELATLAQALERIAREARRQIATVEAERDHLGATVAGMTEGVLVTDPAGRARLVNPAFRRLFGLPESASPDEVLGLARQPRLHDLVDRALGGGCPAAERLELLEPARRTLTLHATELAAGEGVVIVARDVTETERLNQMRTDFVANVSHELKTPLAAIRGYAETLVDGAVDERETALRFSGRILEQCRRLGDLLDDLLTLSRLEGTAPLRTHERVDLREAVEEAIELLRAPAAAKAVTLRLEPGDSPVVPGDPDGILRLVANLLDNAVKYNRPAGEVVVRLRAAAGEAVLEVADTGIGIPAAALPRLFERFYRVDKGRSREEGGTGLGLAIVKHVAQAHGGRVEVESEPGRGSTFRIVLPILPAHRPSGD